MRSEWRKVPLSDVANLTVGFVGTMASEYTSDGVTFIRSLNVHPFRIDLTNVKYISEGFHNKISKSALFPDDVVIVRTGQPGASAVVPQNCGPLNCSDLVIIHPDKSKIDPLFLAAYINWSSRIVNANLVGAVQQHFNVGAAKKMIMNIPDLETQKRISAILGAINDKIELDNRINENLEQQIEALYKSWFVEFEPFDGSAPLNWEKNDIYSIARIIYGAPFSSKLFNTEGNGLPIIRIRDLKDQTFVTYTTEQHPKAYLIKPGDIVVGMDGEFRPYLWGNSEALLNQRVCVFENLRVNGKAFLLCTLKPLLYRIEQTQVATTVIHIGKKDYDAFELLLPDSNTLDKFDDITSPMIDLIVKNRLENKRLASVRDTLLPKLMSGELDLSAFDL